MPLHAGVPGALPDGGVIRERALRFHFRNHHKTICLHRSSKDCFPYAGFFIAGVRAAEYPAGAATWCPATEDQGFDGGETPRPAHRRPGRARQRGAPRRKIKALTGVKHHVPERKNDEQKKDLVQETRSGHLPSVSLHQVFYSSFIRAH